MNRVVLASGSPRRRQLLTGLGLDLVVKPADIDESVRVGESPTEYVRRLALEKAAAVDGGGAPVLAADTTVAVDDDVLGKPVDAAEARSFLRRLSDRWHETHTGIAVNADALVVTTMVRFRPLQLAEINWYLATGEPFDKAGGYAIQGLAASFVIEVRGSVSNVVGLPLAETVGLLRRAGVTLMV